jgi:hypothetical protein
MVSLQKIIPSYIALVETALKVSTQAKYPHAIIRSGSWANKKIYLGPYPR